MHCLILSGRVALPEHYCRYPRITVQADLEQPRRLHGARLEDRASWRRPRRCCSAIYECKRNSRSRCKRRVKHLLNLCLPSSHSRTPAACRISPQCSCICFLHARQPRIHIRRQLRCSPEACWLSPVWCASDPSTGTRSAGCLRGAAGPARRLRRSARPGRSARCIPSCWRPAGLRATALQLWSPASAECVWCCVQASWTGGVPRSAGANNCIAAFSQRFTIVAVNCQSTHDHNVDARAQMSGLACCTRLSTEQTAVCNPRDVVCMSRVPRPAATSSRA